MAKPWLDKHPVLSEDDHPALEAAAAAHEFRGGLSREAAESQAHSDYMKGHAVDAMAHHLIGAKLALAAGNEDAALKHGKGYEQAAKHAGFALDKVPDEVAEVIKTGKHKKLYNHKSHAADEFFLPKDEEGKADKHPEEKHPDNDRVSKFLGQLKQLKELFR